MPTFAAPFITITKPIVRGKLAHFCDSLALLQIQNEQHRCIRIGRSIRVGCLWSVRIWFKQVGRLNYPGVETRPEIPESEGEFRVQNL
jgi:hypothetical protein